MTRTTVLTMLVLGLISSAGLFAADFDGWTLTGTGKQVSPDVLEISGDGKGSAQWTAKPQKLQPGGFYRFGISFRGVDTSGGCLPCGINGFTRDYSARKNLWVDETFYLRLQDNISESHFRLGQWESKGTFQFRNLLFEPVTPIYKEFALPSSVEFILGEGESIRDGVYRFNAWLGGRGSVAHRPLFYSDATFNSNRWCMYENAKVVYRFQLKNRAHNAASPENPGSKPAGLKTIAFDGGTIRLGVCYHSAGEGIVEISRDGKDRWTELGRLDKTGTKDFVLPSLAFPLDEFYLRIRGAKGCNFQVDSIGLEAPLVKWSEEVDWKTINVLGETLFATLDGEKPEQADELALTADGKLRVREPRPDAVKTHVFPLAVSASPGEVEQKIRLGNREYKFTTQTHPLHRSDYGYTLPSVKSPISIWWCEADWKVSRDRVPPASNRETTRSIRISAAKNDVEGFQFVVRAGDKTPLKGLKGTVADLKGPGGAVIPGSNVDMLFAYYHFAHSRTDGTGIVDYWPDALPPLERPLDVEPGKNQPVWINVRVPADAVPGDYQGSFRLASEDGQIDVSVPFSLHVWDFALPTENHLETAFGFNPHRAAQYHNVKTDEDRRRLTDLYLQCFSDHRISIYNPAPYDAFGVKWVPDEKEPEKSRCEIDFSRYDVEMDRVLEKFHFTNFTVQGHGLGWGTFHERGEPSLAGFGEDTPQYKAMMTDYYTKLQNHLEEKGWLDKTYVYWFDEPGKHDYEFVAKGTAKLEKYAPKINRFMTLMMEDTGFLETLDKVGTSINIWCPVSNSFVDSLAEERRKKGERFWWYVCTGPKAPYCTLFIDHPATELRVWHWQAWQREIVGTLVWESVWWTSGTAFPGTFQNPYEDPMAYVSGYSVPPGTKQHWGNGDGRFIYPPLTAAVPGMNEGKPVFDKPVTSIRWEMIREGVEDYEMLYLLRELLAEKGTKLSSADRSKAEELLNVPETVTKSMTEFTIDPRPLLERRNAVGEMIEKLRKID